MTHFFYLTVKIETFYQPYVKIEFIFSIKSFNDTNNRMRTPNNGITNVKQSNIFVYDGMGHNQHRPCL